MANARVVQILKPNANGRYSLTKEFDKLMKKIGDCAVCPISIAGRARTGKSLIMSFLLQRALCEQHGTGEDWLTRLAEDEHQLEAWYEWRGGERVTLGIWTWSEPLMMKMEDGSNVAVLFYDCEGVFDMGSSQTSCATVFVLSLLMSSVHILNIKDSGGLSADDLDSMQLFLDYGSQILQRTDDEYIFQNLWFLIRDWPNERDYKYGCSATDGGQKYLNDFVLEVSNTSDTQKRRIESLKKTFRNFNCFLMPQPGRQIKRQLIENVKVSDIMKIANPEFIEHVKEMIELLLSQSNLEPMRIRGMWQTGKQYQQMVSDFVEAFRRDSNPSASTLSDIYSAHGNEIVVEKSVKIYKNSTSYLQTAVHEALEYYKQHCIPSNTSATCLLRLRARIIELRENKIYKVYDMVGKLNLKIYSDTPGRSQVKLPLLQFAVDRVPVARVVIPIVSLSACVIGSYIYRRLTDCSELHQAEKAADYFDGDCNDDSPTDHREKDRENHGEDEEKEEDDRNQGEDEEREEDDRNRQEDEESESKEDEGNNNIFLLETVHPHARPSMFTADRNDYLYLSLLFGLWLILVYLYMMVTGNYPYTVFYSKF